MSEFTHLTLPQKLQHWAQQRPNAVALRQKDFGIWGPSTGCDDERHAREFGLGLMALGLPPQSRSAIISENRSEWVYTQLGCGMVGMVTVGIYPTSPAAEVAYLLQAADVGAVVCEDQEQLDKVLEAMPELAAAPIMVVIDPKGLRHYSDTAWKSFESVCQLGRDAPAPMQQTQVRTLAQQVPDDIALMIFTSGSTGRPKAAMISYGNITAMALGAPCGRANIHHLFAHAVGCRGELCRIDPHRAKRFARNCPHYFPGRAPHLGKNARFNRVENARGQCISALVV
jgi:long-chain acyl-CoA synthetase